MRIPAYIRRSCHGIFYFRIVVPMALRPRWGGRPEIKLPLKTRDQRQALIRAHDLAIAAHKSFEYAYAGTFLTLAWQVAVSARCAGFVFGRCTVIAASYDASRARLKLHP